jgi:hypothetical protein
VDSISNADLLELFFDAQALVEAQFQYWLSVSFAAIVASFVARDRLTRKLGVVLVALYLSATTLFVLRYYAAIGELGNIAGEAMLRELLSDRGPRVVGAITVARTILFILGTGITTWFLLHRSKESSVAV